jgi:hypothetical protein
VSKEAVMAFVIYCARIFLDVLRKYITKVSVTKNGLRDEFRKGSCKNM